MRYHSTDLSIMSKLFLLIIVFSLCTTTSYALTQTDACNILLKVAVKRHFSASESPSGYYDCDSDEWGHKRYFVFGLHYRLKISTGNDGSNLVGWYAVDKITGQLFEWNMANLRVGDAIDTKGH
jgi:hypothetical protein